MANLFHTNSGEQSEHPAREMLLLYVDGELTQKDTAQLDEHLEACWPCRVRTKRIQESIADIIEFDEQARTPRLDPPRGWRSFDGQLTQLAAESGKQSFASRLLGSWNRLFPDWRFFATSNLWFKPMLRGLAVALALIVVVALVIRLRQEPVVSATELLRNVSVAQAAKINSIDDPVVHQRLRVLRKDRLAAGEATLEIWNDTKNTRVRTFKTNPVIDELTQVLAANHMDPQRPLSAASYESWHNTLQGERDEVSHSKLADGVDALTLRTVPAPPVNLGQIAEAFLIVRTRDWQPSQLKLNVRAEEGIRTYELTVDLSEVLQLAQVDRAIFGEAPMSQPAPKASPQASPAKLNPTAVPLSPGSLNAIASADLEVEALRLLNQVGADLGEQISIARTTDGILQIRGIVETEQRKTEITNALAPINTNPAVRIEIQTVAEAVAKETNPNTPKPSPSMRAVQIAGDTMAAEPELRTYFAREGGDTDQRVRRFAARMISLSNQGMAHLWALKRLLNQFSPEEQRSLTPEGKAKWLALIRAHARAYQQSAQSLRQELQPVFFPQQSGGAAADGAVIADGNELARAVEQLFESGSSNDRVIRSAFTASSDGAMTTVIKTPQFYQSLKNAEVVAARISSVN